MWIDALLLVDLPLHNFFSVNLKNVKTTVVDVVVEIRKEYGFCLALNKTVVLLEGGEEHDNIPGNEYYLKGVRCLRVRRAAVLLALF